MANILHTACQINFLDKPHCILVDIWLEFIPRSPFDMTPALVKVIVLHWIDNKQLA